jgi:hypothetical protein
MLVYVCSLSLLKALLHTMYLVNGMPPVQVDRHFDQRARGGGPCCA